jgi:hypothetical protein
MDKKTGQLSTHVFSDVERQIRGLASLEGMSTSEYLYEKIILVHLLCKRREFSVLLDVFGDESSMSSDSFQGRE